MHWLTLRARGRFVSAELIVSQNTSCHSEGLALLENIVAEPAQTTESQAPEIRPLSGTVLMAAISGNFARSRFDFPSEATSQRPPSKPQANKHMNEHNILPHQHLLEPCMSMDGKRMNTHTNPQTEKVANVEIQGQD